MILSIFVVISGLAPASKVHVLLVVGFPELAARSESAKAFMQAGSFCTACEL